MGTEVTGMCGAIAELRILVYCWTDLAKSIISHKMEAEGESRGRPGLARNKLTGLSLWLQVAELKYAR